MGVGDSGRGNPSSGSESEEGEDMSPGPGMMPEERREIHLFRQCPDHHPQKTDRQVPDGGHVLGAEPLPDRGAIFGEDRIAAPVEGVFDAPVVAVVGEETSGRSGILSMAGDSVDNLRR